MPCHQVFSPIKWHVYKVWINWSYNMACPQVLNHLVLQMFSLRCFPSDKRGTWKRNKNKLTRERTREKYQREWITNESKKNNNGTIVLQKVKIQEQKKSWRTWFSTSIYVNHFAHSKYTKSSPLHVPILRKWLI